MPNTRSSNKTANYKAYYSKKAAPYQQHFPHRRKTVRHPDPEPQDEGGKKQMRFLPEMMRRRGTVQDSDDEGFEEVEVQSKGTRKKRSSDVMCEEVEGEGEEAEEEAVPRPSSKRRRKAEARIATPKPESRRTRAAPVAHAVRGEDSDGTSGTEEEVPKSKVRRQSTMTQIVGGRSLVPGSIEPKFKPVKRTPRTSWSGNGRGKEVEKDKKQRTLTQMVHNMTPLVLDSDDEVEEEDKEEEEIDAAHRSFIFGSDEETVAQHTPRENVDEENLTPATESLHVINDDDSEEDEYQPTQFIETPTTKTRRTPLRSSTRQRATPTATKASRTQTKKLTKTRFGLLSTPEKSGVFEIPSSQSPPETPFSTQNTPKTLGRTPLKPRSANAPKATGPLSNPGAETPSKRKQVTFQEGSQEQIPPTTLRKFASTIPDSEDDFGDLSDNDGESDAGYGVGDETQALLCNVDGPISGVSIGTETQAMLLDIDRACANADEDAAWRTRDGSEELGKPVINHDEGPQELGQQPPPPRTVSTSTKERSSDAPELPPLPFSSPKLPNTLPTKREPAAATDTITSPPIVQQLPSSPPIKDFRTQPPTPMFADDGSHEEVEVSTTATINQASTPTKQSISSMPIEDFRTQPTLPMFNDDEPSEDLDDVANVTPRQPDIQVPRSPPARLHPEPSHSSQAERQLQSEYQTYSQYRRPGPAPSSMYVAHDSNYSYQATPHAFPAHLPTQLPQAHSSHISQATTVDPTQPSPKVTPQKPKIKKEPMFTRSATRTPKRNNRSAATTPKSQSHRLISSPEADRPAPLFIPSSFPSPARVTMEGWSSPVLGRELQGESQWGVGSLEEFSIPPPPPGEWGDSSEEEEEEEEL